MDSKFAWGNSQTEFFFDLTPEKVLDAVESAGLQCTGRCMALNSMENRVYEVEIEWDSDQPPKSPSEKFRVVKFYRPGRWTQAQILEEHEFLVDLESQEIPVIAPLKFSDGTTLQKMPNAEIWYALFPKMGGRSPDELTDEQVERLGRMLARIHTVGSQKTAQHRVSLTPEIYGINNLKSLVDSHQISSDVEGRYIAVVEKICAHTRSWFSETTYQRIHGDCHFGNILWNDRGPTFLDFDDFVKGPCVQDLWLILPGRDEFATRQFQILVESYEQMKTFDRRSLRLIEPLRALRFVHFSAWISKRWDDPSFPARFPAFGTPKYWHEQVADLEDQWELISQQG